MDVLKVRVVEGTDDTKRGKLKPMRRVHERYG
jgi:hypothetical protein